MEPKNLDEQGLTATTEVRREIVVDLHLLTYNSPTFTVRLLNVRTHIKRKVKKVFIKGFSGNVEDYTKHIKSQDRFLLHSLRVAYVDVECYLTREDRGYEMGRKNKISHPMCTHYKRNT